MQLNHLLLVLMELNLFHADIVIYDTQTYSQLYTITDSNDSNQVIYNPDNKILISTNRHYIKIWGNPYRI